MVRAARRSLRDHHAAHAVADEHRRLAAPRKHGAGAVDVGSERHACRGGAVIARAGQVEGLDGVPGGGQRPDDRLPAPGAAVGAVHEYEAGHVLCIHTRRTTARGGRPPRGPQPTDTVRCSALSGPVVSVFAGGPISMTLVVKW